MRYLKPAATIAATLALLTPAATSTASPATTLDLWDAPTALSHVASISADNPASKDWNTAKADNAATRFPKAFEKTSGRTGWFGESWYDVDGNGCDTRDDILARDMSNVAYKKKSTCTVASGTLADPYTGTTINFKRGKQSSQAVQIDHIIPLGYVYAHGGWAWDADKRLNIANDPLNLLAVDGPTNGSKSDSGPTTSPKGASKNNTYQPSGGPGWEPANKDYTCAYAARFTQVAVTYQLGLPASDKQWLTDTLTVCAGNTASQDAATVGGADQTVGQSPASKAPSTSAAASEKVAHTVKEGINDHRAVMIAVVAGILIVGGAAVVFIIARRR